MDGDVWIGGDRLAQGGLQIAAMNHPIGCAIAFVSGGAERRARQQSAGARVEHAQLVRRDDLRPQAVTQSKPDQDLRCIGRELDAGAGFLEALGLFQNGGAESRVAPVPAPP